ncbi:hypothetical protein DPMN_122533 [Dreissena polymorpha]|uniref:CARD domain-containing protein n=1 Tax=Dreissena polymorpha TaxID=45954 RepID=A0A9D4GSP3_DREPO|nr:hypothetical protein DPMN_122533 [Dreissena polymorpha]
MSSFSVVTTKRMDDFEWSRKVNRVITKRWTEIKTTLVMKDFVDYLIQKGVVTLDYWMGLKAKPVTESERMEDFLHQVSKFTQQKYNYFLEALLTINRHELVQNLIINQKVKPKKVEPDDKLRPMPKESNATQKSKTPKSVEPRLSKSADGPTMAPADTFITTLSETKGQSDIDQLSEWKFTSLDTTDGTGVTSVDKIRQVAKEKQAQITERLYQGIATKEDINIKKDPDKKAKKTVEFKDTSEKDVDETNPRPGTSKSREDLLEEREKQLRCKESELKQKEKVLNEREMTLMEKEQQLLTRENSLAHMEISRPTTATLTFTQTSELMDIREQLKALKKAREQEIESEHTTYCNTPKDEYVTVMDFKIVQQEIAELKQDITEDREAKQVIQQKVEDMKQEINTLQRTIEKLNNEKTVRNAEIDREISVLKVKLTKAETDRDESIGKLRMELKSKEEESMKVKASLEQFQKHSSSLEKRVVVLETDKLKYEAELQQYEKEVSNLRQNLEVKEQDLNDLKNVLEETESEKEDLIEMLNKLKHEIDDLKSDKKRLETEKKTLLARCVKPQWSGAGGSRRPSIR